MSGRSVFEPRQRQMIFPLASMSIAALRPSQLPVQWVPWVLSPGVKRGRGVTLTNHPNLVPRSRMSKSYIFSPPSVLLACSGTALPYLVSVPISPSHRLYLTWYRFQSHPAIGYTEVSRGLPQPPKANVRIVAYLQLDHDTLLKSLLAIHDYCSVRFNACLINYKKPFFYKVITFLSFIIHY
jgi:hypothetical protein